MSPSKRRYACGRVYRVIVGLDKFWKNVYLSVGIFISKEFLQRIANRPMSTFHVWTFDVGIFSNLKLDALLT